MKKTIKLGIVFPVMLLACGYLSQDLLAEQKPEQKVEQKKDVSDPVLQEVITAFGSKMPRFIDKHGKELFVADAPVTRGTLMLALYEYDKSFKALKKDFVSKQEFSELVSKVGTMGAPQIKPLAGHAAALDTAQLINDLMPNMPVILDSSLNNSKVFQSLKEQIAQRGQGPNDEQYKTTLEQTRNELLDLTKKVDSMERPGPQPKNADSYLNTGDIKKTLAITRVQVDRLEEKVNELEKRKPEAQTAKKDISQIITDLTPNMPGILDNSLNNSKVFQGLKEQMSQRGQGANDGQFKSTLDQTRYQLLDLSKRVDSMEKFSTQSKNLDSSLLTTGDIKKTLALTRMQMDKLEQKMSEMEKRKPDTQTAKKDISQIITDLTPNMPGLLDNSLNNSKVFQSLKEQIAQRGQGTNDEQFKTTLEQTRFELLDLSKRVDNMEKFGSQSKNTDSLATTGDIKRNLAMTRAQLEKLTEKVSEMEKRRPELQVVKKDASSGSSEESKAYSSTLAKLSMGLSMVAALFIAR